jgi:hypothetical protein
VMAAGEVSVVRATHRARTSREGAVAGEPAGNDAAHATADVMSSQRTPLSLPIFIRN